MTTRVRDLMHPGLITCRPDTTLGQVALMLTHHHIHSLIVADRDGRPVGILTDFDLLDAPSDHRTRDPGGPFHQGNPTVPEGLRLHRSPESARTFI